VARISTFDDWVDLLKDWQNDIGLSQELVDRYMPGYQFEAKYGELPTGEIYFGDWENKSWEEIATRDPATAAAWLIAWPHHAAPGGESFGHFVERVKDELNALAGRRYGPCTVAITHAGFIAVAVSMVTGKPIASVRQPAYGDVLEFQRFGDTWILRDKS